MEARSSHLTMRTDGAFVVDSSGQRQFKQKSQVSFDSPVPPRLPLSDEEFVQGAVVPGKAKSLNQLLIFTTVENLLANGGNLTTLKENDTIELALKTFKETEVQSVPVYDASGKFVRILNISEIFFYFSGIEQDNWEGFFLKTIGSLCNDGLAAESPMIPIGTTMSEVVKTLATGVHHVGILDPFSHVLFNIISQLFVVRFIAKNISLVPRDLRLLPVQSFMKQIVNVQTIPSDTSTREAFEYLFKGNISAAAVVHHISGSLMDTVSTTDLVGVVYDRFKHLHRPLIEFLYATRRTKALKPPITCRMEDTFEYVLLKLASTGVHRLWVVDSKTQLQYLGLVNLTNVMEAIVRTFE